MYHSNMLITERLGHYNILCIIHRTVHIQVKGITIKKFVINTGVIIIHTYIHNTVSGLGRVMVQRS